MMARATSGYCGLGMKTDGLNPAPTLPMFHILPGRFRIFGKIRKRGGVRDGVAQERDGNREASTPPVSSGPRIRPGIFRI
jgi:hypothetical protein